MLKNMDGWLEKAVAFSKTKNFEADTLVSARLAPDMYPLARQVQSACDGAKFSTSYMSGKTPPVNPDEEKTIAELRTRIRSTLSWLETVSAADLNGWEERKASPKWLQGKWMKGDQYCVQSGMPNFYFHCATAYAILRHNGVDVGKMDFLGSLPIQG
jgi:hypothetical protein